MHTDLWEWMGFPKGAEGRAHGATVHHFPAVVVPGEVPGSQMGQEGLEGGFRQLQGCQPELRARESHGADHPGCQENQGISPRQPGFVKGRVCPSILISQDLPGG